MLRQVLVLSLSLLTLTVYGCSQSSSTSLARIPCSSTWFEAIESKVGTGDGQGHGPDIGSMEWRSVIEFKLGVRGAPETPSRDSRAWCNYIDRLVVNAAE